MLYNYFLLQPIYVNEFSQNEVLDLIGMNGVKVVLEFVHVDNNFPVTVSSISVIACAEFSEYIQCKRSIYQIYILFCFLIHLIRSVKIDSLSMTFRSF